MAGGRNQEKGAAGYAREALQHWGSAARYGFEALAAKRRERGEGHATLAERLDGLKSALSGSEAADGESLAGVELPIQESIDVALPLSAVYAVCTQFEDFPQFLDRVESVELEGERQLRVVAKIGGSVRELEIEVMDERPDERLDWACEDGYEHSGVVTFHPLAPRLTRLELTVERQPESVAERLARRLGLPQRTIQEELRRFKAYAELWEEADEAEPADVPVPEDEAEEDAEPAEEEEPTEEEEPEDEELDEGEEPVEDEEPAEAVQTSD